MPDEMTRDEHREAIGLPPRSLARMVEQTRELIRHVERTRREYESGEALQLSRVVQSVARTVEELAEHLAVALPEYAEHDAADQRPPVRTRPPGPDVTLAALRYRVDAGAPWHYLDIHDPAIRAIAPEAERELLFR